MKKGLENIAEEQRIDRYYHDDRGNARNRTSNSMKKKKKITNQNEMFGFIDIFFGIR
jgi:hypothetical protein